MFAMIPTLISLILSSASAQIPEPFECSTYEPCLVQNDIYVTSTCQPMSNATMNAVCMCYANVNRNLCFLQCPTDQKVQTAAAAFQSTLTASCAAVNLNPKLLPPAPWVTYKTTTTTKATSTSADPSSATIIPASSSGNAVTNIGIAVVAFMAMYFAI